MANSVEMLTGFQLAWRLSLCHLASSLMKNYYLDRVLGRLCKMLYQKLATALGTRDIDELGLLHCIPDLSELPSSAQTYYPLVVVETKLGFPLQCLPTLLKEAAAALQDANGKDQQEQSSRIMILLKPDHYTAMNTRKRLILSKYVSLAEEIKLLNLVFTIPKHTKSATAWHHRKWLYTLEPNRLVLDDELSHCARTATLHARNYCAWLYRGWLLDTFIAPSMEMIGSEYIRTRAWVEQNVSDHSGAHYLARVILTAGPDNIGGKDHMAWLDGLILQYPGHESLWYHRRFCFETLFSAVEGHVFVERAVGTVEKTHEKEPEIMHRQLELAYRYGLWLCIKGQTCSHGNVYRKQLVQLGSQPKIYGIGQMKN